MRSKLLLQLDDLKKKREVLNKGSKKEPFYRLRLEALNREILRIARELEYLDRRM